MLSLSDLIYQNSARQYNDDQRDPVDPIEGVDESPWPRSETQERANKRQRLVKEEYNENEEEALNNKRKKPARTSLQRQQQQQPPPPPQKQQQSPPRQQSPDDTPSQPWDDDDNPNNDNEDDALNAFYFGEASNDHHNNTPSCNDNDNEKTSVSKKSKTLLTPPPVLSLSKPSASSVSVTLPSGTIPLRRRHRRRRRWSRPDDDGGVSSLEQESDYYYETPEQAIQRLKRLAAEQVRRRLRFKWRQRKLNMAKEVDIGNAIATLALESLRQEQIKLRRKERRKSLKQHQQQQQQRQQQQQQTNNMKSPAANPSSIHDVLMDSSDEEREAALGSLLRNSQEPSNDLDQNADAETPVMEEFNKNAEDYYWQLGYVAPPKKELTFNYRDMVKKVNVVPKLKNTTVSSDNDDDDEQEVMFSKSLLLPYPYLANVRDDFNLYFPLSHDSMANWKFSQPRQLLHMATRYIVSSAGESTNSKSNMDQRLLRLICRKSTRKVGRLFLLLTQAREAARNLLLFRQYKWTNSSLVAARLGVAASQEFGVGWTDQLPIPWLSGYTMERCNVQQASRRERNCLIKEYGEMDWSKENVTDSVPAEEKNINNNENSSDSNNADSQQSEETTSQNAVFGTCTYTHFPGTTPPIPNFPLDETQVIFGPRDRHAHGSHFSKLDDATYHLTLCSLLSHWIAALERQPNDASTWWTKIETFIEQVPNLNASKLYIRLLKYTNRVDVDNLPLVSYYNALMGYCSLVANLPFATSANMQNALSGKCDDASETDNDNDDSNNEGESNISCDHSKVARTIHDYCEKHIGHNSLLHFPKLHITYGLVSVAKMLPPSAAELLSLPFDDVQRRTPFDIMRLTLEHLEDERLLKEADAFHSNFGNNTIVTFVIAGELEYTLHKASEAFADLVRREHDNLDNHLWYLSALSGCLLLCSGCRIGGGKAWRYPSSKSSIHDKSCDRRVEVRCKMRTFDKVRREVAEEFFRMVTLAREQQGGCRSHLAVASFLEWRQVVALLLGPGTGIESICKLHSRHVLSLAQSDPRDSVLRHVAYLWDRKLIDSNDYVSMLAVTIENNPSDRHIWRKLVAVLGPVGVPIPEACQDLSCPECTRLGRGLKVNHEIVNANKRNPHWWGKTRVSWWLNHQLRQTTVTSQPTSKPLLEAYKKIDTLLTPMKHLPLNLLSAKVLEPTTQSEVEADEELSWLPLSEVHWIDEVEDDSIPPLPLDHLDMLPVPFHEVLETTSDNSEVREDLDSFSPPIRADNQHLEALCHKVIVTCHLYSITEESVTRAVEFLAKQCVGHWETSKFVKTNCDEWRCLVWLSSFGLNVGKILQVDVPRAPRVYDDSIPSKYSLEEQQAVRDGIERFGVGFWSQIRAHEKKLFGNKPRDRVRDIYRWLLKRGKVNVRGVVNNRLVAEEVVPPLPVVRHHVIETVMDVAEDTTEFVENVIEVESVLSDVESVTEVVEV